MTTSCAFFELKVQFDQVSGDDLYPRWARWFFAPTAARPLSSASTVRLADYVEQCLAGEEDYQAAREAVMLVPTNGAALARLANQLRTHKPDENPRWTNESAWLMQRAAELAPADVAVQRASADFLGQKGQWKEAARDLALVIERGSGDPKDWLRLAAVLLELGEEPGYRALRARMVGRFGETNDLQILERTARVYLLQPGAGPEFEAVCGWADRAFRESKDEIDLGKSGLTQGLAEYRRGHFEQAVDLMRQTLARRVFVPILQATFDVRAGAVLAMAQHQFQQPDAARASLAKAEELAKSQLPQIESGRLGEYWHDWLLAHILLREARSVVEGMPLEPGTQRGAQ